MTSGKFWAYTGIVLAVEAFIYTILPGWALFLIGIGIFGFCIVLTLIINAISNTHHKWVDKIYYFFTRRKEDYIILDETSKYCITSQTAAEYDRTINVINKKDGSTKIYEGRIVWDQDNDLNVIGKCDREYKFEISQDLKWTNTIFTSKNILHTNDKSQINFKIDNLHISQLKKKSFLYCKVRDKIKFLRLVVEVEPSLKPAPKALFKVLNANGEEIPNTREEIELAPDGKTFEKTITCPRIGRRYAIQWDYEI
ncbi:MAG: hypothetical protein J1E81_06295 [Eubacterium sp.]|nr:hypothetical protein [Eubacterium sp.]